jgi:phage gp36-like protein
MSYCTVADLIARFSETEIAQLTDLDDRETVVEATVQSAITDASGEIDSYLGGRYATPMTGTVPQQVKNACMDIARYRLYDDHPTDNVRQRYTDALAWLKLVMMGHISLSIAAPASDALTGGLAYSDPADDTDNPTFTRLVWDSDG